jgi:L-fuculose-phosphate aldolase
MSMAIREHDGGFLPEQSEPLAAERDEILSNRKGIRQQVCEVGQRLYQSGFAAANDGNISVRLSEDRILTTPTGVSKGSLTPDMLVDVDLAGKVLVGDRLPSSELKMHLRIYAERPDVGAVVHAHPPYATAFAITGQPLNEPVIAEAVVTVGPIALAPYATPSTAAVADSIAPFLADHDAILLSNHGALTYGHDLTSAHFRMESLEFYARLLALSRQLGQPRVLSAEQVAELRTLRERMQGARK